MRSLNVRMGLIFLLYPTQQQNNTLACHVQECGAMRMICELII